MNAPWPLATTGYEKEHALRRRGHAPRAMGRDGAEGELVKLLKFKGLSGTFFEGRTEMTTCQTSRNYPGGSHARYAVERERAKTAGLRGPRRLRACPTAADTNVESRETGQQACPTFVLFSSQT